MTRHRDRVARNVARIELSAIMDMSLRAAREPGAVSLAWGLPSFRTPAHIRAAVQHALDADPDVGKYSLGDGLPELRAAVAREHLAATGIGVDSDAQVLITAGNMEGLNVLFHTLLNPGDRVIVTDPGFVSHIHQIELCGGQATGWRLDESRGWALDLDALPGLIDERTKAILLVTPSNPTGRIFTEHELRRVGEIARERDVLVLLDDPYRHFTYGNRALYFNLASVPELAGHVVYLFSFSKCYAMSGWRLGYLVAPAALKRELMKVHDATVLCAPRVSQVAGLAALTGPRGHLREFELALARRRDLICARLDRLPRVFEYSRPEGAYYVFPRIVAPHASSTEFADRLLRDVKVGVTPGSAFGAAGEHHVRMAFCVEEREIDLAFDRIEAAFPR
ncbi:MAG TPA: pyridoxal phosphate-dependent aminotransferase [Gammaproteobacteria bacterium]|nr:pyridoxal phosphate-dependent aminotransferase [Gammaproteobacteria bacterium]